MATARERRAFRAERKRIEREAVQDAAAARHRFQTAQRALAAYDRTLKNSAHRHSRRSIIRVAAKAVRHPVRPPPFYSRAGISYSRRLQTIDGIQTTSFHCAVSQTSQGSKAVAHQVYIERESAVVASFGTLGETIEERKEVWAELDARAPLKRGCITLPESATPDLREALRPVLQRLADDGAIPRRPTAAWLRQPNRRLAIRGLDHERYETLAHAIGDAYRDAIDRDWAAATRAGKPPTLPPKILGHPPRSPMLQRRIVLELPHEVTDHAREQILRDFCARTFGRRGIPFHAVIHAPAAGNDDRNFHAHIVSTHHQICRDRSTGRWDFLASEEMPAVHEFGRQITSNACSPEGKALPAAERRTIQRNLFRELRQTFATAANDALRMEIVLKRYDPRSYHDRGLAITPGSHLGPAAAAAAKRGGTVGRSPHRAAWLNAAAALAEAAPDDEDPEEIRRLIDTEMVAQSLPHDCLPPDCHGEIQADRRRLARLRAKVESSFFALAARAHLARPNAPALPQHPAPPATESPRPLPVQDPQATPQRPTASGTEFAVPGIHPLPALRTARTQAISRPRRASLLAPALPQRPVPPAAESSRPLPVQDPQATPQRPTASGTEFAVPGIHPLPALRTARTQAISRPRRASLLAPALPQRPVPPAAESPRSLPVQDPQATPQRPTASGTEFAVPGIHPLPALRTARTQAISRPRRASLLAPALPQRPVPPAAESPRPLPVQDPQATPQRPTASGTEFAVPGIHPLPALRTARTQAISRPRRASLLAPALPQRPVPPAAESPRPLPVQDPQATPQRPTASGTEFAVPGIHPLPALRTARTQAISRPRRASLLAPALPQRPVPPAAEFPRSVPVPDPQATSQRPTASGTEFAVPGIHPLPALRTARTQAISRPRRASLLAPALPQRPVPPAAESPRPLPVQDPQATPQRPTASGTEFAVPGIHPLPALRTARTQAISRPRRASLLAPALPQRPVPPAAEFPRSVPVPDPQATSQRPTASGANLAIPGILPPPVLRTARPQAISRPRRADLLAPAIPRTPDALHEVLHAHLPTMGAEYLTTPPGDDYFRTPIPGLSRTRNNRRPHALKCAERTLGKILDKQKDLFPPLTTRPSAARKISIKRWHTWLAEHPDRHTHLADEMLASMWPDYQRDHDLEPAPIPPTPAALLRFLNGHLRRLGDEIVRAPAQDDGFDTSIPGLGPTALLCVFQTLRKEIPNRIRRSGAEQKSRYSRWSDWLDSPPDRRGYLAALLTKAVWPVHQHEHSLDPALRAPERPPAPSRPARTPQQPGWSR